jgi:hypothetical protein
MTKPYERQPQVLRLLAEHGPLSAQGIRACLSPPPSPRALRFVLQRLYRHRLLARRYDRVSRHVFHQLAQNPLARNLVAASISLPSEELVQPHFRHAELLHSEDCAIWCELLRLILPNVRVQRDYQFSACVEAQEILLSRGEERDLAPDILLVAPTPNGTDRIYIAVEIERSAKGEKRLIRKLRKYAEQTRLDGLIYICGSASIQRKLLAVYKSKVADRALRISHYADDFFLFADGRADIRSGEPLMLNAAGKNVPLRSWMRTLGETKDDKNDDSVF